MTLRALVVDDEPAARAGLAAMVRSDPAFGVVDESGGRDDAVAAIRAHRPDVVLLDIELNPGTGFDVVDRIGSESMPLVVFVTAFDQFAIDAFEKAAVDYLLKPVGPERLCRALTRVKERLREASAGRATSRQQLPRPIVVPDGGRTLLFAPEEIIWVEAADYCARVHARGRAWLVRQSLDAFEATLPAPPFLRVHRSAIANLQYVVEVTRTTRHRHVMVLRDGTRVPLSAERRNALDPWLRPA